VVVKASELISESEKRHNLSGLSRVLHPQEQWEWPIAAYLYLAGLGAGALAVGLIADWILHPNIPSKAILRWGVILVTIGAPFLILDLGKKLRFLNASLNPWTSWAGRGFLILSTLMITGLIIFGVSLLPSVLPLLNIKVPTWINPDLRIFRILEVVVVVVAIGTAAYTGIFLKSTRYITLWNTWFLPVLFTVSAFSTGTMGIIVSLLGYGLIIDKQVVIDLSHTLMPVEQICVLLEAVVLAAFVVLRYRAGETGTRSVRLLLTGKLRFVFWVGIVALGLVFPIILENVYSRFPDYPALLYVTGASLLTGGFFLRYGIVKGGIKDRHPLQKMAALQYDWQALKIKSQGSEVGITEVRRG
jgi:polysulfide reductase chain C